MRIEENINIWWIKTHGDVEFATDDEYWKPTSELILWTKYSIYRTTCKYELIMRCVFERMKNDINWWNDIRWMNQDMKRCRINSINRGENEWNGMKWNEKMKRWNKINMKVLILENWSEKGMI